MSMDHLIQAIREKLSSAPPIGATLLFDCGVDGLIFVDGTGAQPVISMEKGEEPATTLACSAATLEAILSGAQDPTMAYMTGKLKVKGSMGYALKLNGILGD